MIVWEDGRPHFWHENFATLLANALIRFNDFSIFDDDSQVICTIRRFQ